MPAPLSSVSAIHLPTYNNNTTTALPPPPSDRALAATRRGPSSVSSRSTGTRRHRSSRSHQTNNSFRPQNEFPNFAVTGDVEIVLSTGEGGQERRYMLHRLILSQSSGFFEASTSDDWSKARVPTTSSAEVAGNNGAGSTLSSIGEDDESSSTISQSQTTFSTLSASSHRRCPTANMAL